jgi:hypothetical protein
VLLCQDVVKMVFIECLESMDGPLVGWKVITHRLVGFLPNNIVQFVPGFAIGFCNVPFQLITTKGDSLAYMTLIGYSQQGKRESRRFIWC